MRTQTSDLKFQAGDRVCYSESHWDWMKRAGLVPDASKRTTFTGAIVSIKKDHVTVGWAADWATPIVRSSKGFPLPLMPTSHFPENLAEA